MTVKAIEVVFLIPFSIVIKAIACSLHEARCLVPEVSRIQHCYELRPLM
jgi:hypothetical protein